MPRRRRLESGGMAEYKQNKVSAAIWPWAGDRPAAVAAPAVYRRSLIQAAVVAAIGLFVLLKMRHAIVGSVVLAMAAVLLVTGLFLPGAFRRIESWGQQLGKAVGAGMTWMLLVPFFYLCFLPGNLLLRALKKDPLKLKFPSNEPTYWTHRPPVIDVSRFRSQY
jgi:hypothetical protein